VNLISHLKFNFKCDNIKQCFIHSIYKKKKLNAVSAQNDPNRGLRSCVKGM